MIKGTVAIIGRVNVGKSTLYNTLSRSRSSIVSDRKGVTRDFLGGPVLYDKSGSEGFWLYDTGGFETKGHNFQPFGKEDLVWVQSQKAVEKSDLILLVFDGKDGVQHFDREILRYIQKVGKPVLYIVNKIDGLEKSVLALEFHSLGIEDPILISAAYRRGIAELYARIAQKLSFAKAVKKEKLLDQTQEAIEVSLIGRPNVGKSSILNRLIGEERSLVSDVAGTTRDRIDTYFHYKKDLYRFVDTAVVRRRTKIDDEIESLSVSKSIRAIEQSDVLVAIIDAIEGMADQDIRLVNMALKRHKPVLLVVNKWDLITEKKTNSSKDYEANIRRTFLGGATYVPVLFVSCLKNQRIHKIMDYVKKVYQQTQKRVNTALVNETLEKMVAHQAPRVVKRYSKRIKFYYATQLRTKPPTFVVKCNIAKDMQESYRRYMLKTFQTDLGFKDVPIKLCLEDKKVAKIK